MSVEEKEEKPEEEEDKEEPIEEEPREEPVFPVELLYPCGPVAPVEEHAKDRPARRKPWWKFW